MLIRNANAFIDGCFVPETDVLVKGGRIAAVGRQIAAQDEQVVDLGGDYLLPGFVDVHIHGYGGYGVMDGEAALRGMSRALKKAGVAAFLPTTGSDDPQKLAAAVAYIRAVMDRPEEDGAVVLGAHMEGPFMNGKKCGAMLSENFLPPTAENFERITGGAYDAVRLISMAPELDGGEAFIRLAREKGVHVSIGHTAADAQTVHDAAAWGADHVTHTFNASSPLQHRAPGVPGAALVDDRLICEVIGDGVHVHPDIVRLIARCKGAARTAVVTDALSVSGLPEGEYGDDGHPVIVRSDAVYLPSGTLTGSCINMAQAFSNLIAFGIVPEDAALMTTATPARSVGCTDAGVIREGAVGILARFDKAFAFVQALG